MRLKGFRPGQAPREMAKQYVNEERVFERAANSAIRQSLNELAEENKWTIIDKPKVVIDSNDGLDFKYSAYLILFPEVALGDYKKIAKNSNARLAEKLKTITIMPDEIDRSFDSLKKSGANLENFKDDGDLKKSIGEGLKIEKAARERDIERLKMLDELIKSSKTDIPQVMIDQTQKTHSASSGQASLTDERAQKSIAQHLIIFKIAQLENLHPTPQEVGDDVQAYLNQHLAERKKIDKRKLYDYIYGVIQNRKVFDYLNNI